MFFEILLKETKSLQLKEKGNELYRQKKFKEAKECYEQAIEINDSDDVLYSNKGLCEKNLKLNNEAIVSFTKAIKLNPKNIQNYIRVSTLLIAKGNLGLAKEVLEEAHKREPDNLAILTEYNSINAILQEGSKLDKKIEDRQFKEAEKICENLLEKTPNFTYVIKAYIKILLEQCKFKEAMLYIMKLIKEYNPFEIFDDKELFYMLPLTLYYAGKYNIAEELIEKCPPDEKFLELKNRIKKIQIIKEAANSKFSQQKYQEAINEYTKALKFDPDNKAFNSTILANRALCYQKLKKLDSALQDIEQSLRINPYYATGYQKRGSIYMDLQMYKNAESDFLKAKELDPDSKVSKYLETIRNKIDNNDTGELNVLKNKIKELTDALIEEREKNKNAQAEIIKLKNIINNKDYILEEKKDQIEQLKKKIEKLKILKDADSNMPIDEKNEELKDRIIDLMGRMDSKELEIKQKDTEISDLKSKIPFEIHPGEKLMSIIILSCDQKIHHSIICTKGQKFSYIEDILYQFFPDYMDTDNYYLVHGSRVNKNKTLEENKIKDNDIISLYKFDLE